MPQKGFLVFDINPIGKPRMVRSDAWRQRPAVLAYWVFKAELERQAALFNYQIGHVLDIEFYLPMPPSWSKKKRLEMNGAPHQNKPDIDNLIKSFMDCLKENDSDVWSVTATKRWGVEGFIKVIT